MGPGTIYRAGESLLQSELNLFYRPPMSPKEASIERSLLIRLYVLSPITLERILTRQLCFSLRSPYVVEFFFLSFPGARAKRKKHNRQLSIIFFLLEIREGEEKKSKTEIKTKTKPFLETQRNRCVYTRNRRS